LEDIVDRSKKQKTETFDSNAAASLSLPLWFGSTCTFGAMHSGDSVDVSENLQDSVRSRTTSVASDRKCNDAGTDLVIKVLLCITAVR
jgi:hypothetical protein